MHRRRPRAPRIQIPNVAHAAAGVNVDVGQRRRERRYRLQRRPSTAADPCQVEHDQFADGELTSEPDGGARFVAGELRPRRDQHAVAEVDAQHRQGAAGLAVYPASDSDSVPITLRATPALWSAAARAAVVAPASAHSSATAASRRSVSTSAGAPAIASRSATYKRVEPM